MSFSSDKPHGADQPGTDPPGTDRRDERPFGADNPYAGLLNTLSNATWQVVLTAGVVAIALGIMVLAWPGATLVVVGALFGTYLLVSGIFQLAGAFGAHVPGHMRVLSFISGGLSVVLGLLCFRGPAQSILLLALWIGFGWLLRGVMLTATAISAEGRPARGWQLALGVLTALAGILLIILPFGSITALAIAAGVWLIALGVIEVIHAVQLRAELGHGTPRKAHRGFHFRSQPHPQP
ncbi:HdeD family acid-resistance protein [Streptomyces sp. NPDC005271]|uniref:HdeD family acid-resistance protein n=1 Tax=unclassified Streptomyces TaxID=2593676 RepID=UPI0033A86946